MGTREISLTLPTGYDEDQLRRRIGKHLGIRSFSYRIERKSLDARKRGRVFWKVRISVFSREVKGPPPLEPPALEIPFKKRGEKIVVVGSGPAGFFAAFVLQKAGFHTTLIERGAEVGKRARGIRGFERTGRFDPLGNYAFGEGGAGTFSDGKLTSRTKHISRERQFILSQYIRAGAPEEIRYLAHPHLGSDNLAGMVKRLRQDYLAVGGTVLFETFLQDLKVQDGKVLAAVTTSGDLDAERFIVAPGHSAYETYRMLIRKGVRFRSKAFALGCRVEHPQEMINLAQWGREHLPGVRAAEYRLTSKGADRLPVYTFCMCPGGKIVPASAYGHINIVNGMSRYQRAGRFANAACVALVGPGSLTAGRTSPEETLDRLEALEERFYQFSDGFRAPSCSIQDFISEKGPSCSAESSYPLGLIPSALWELLPVEVSRSLREGLLDFSRKLKGFQEGVIMGLESKTSSPIQALRDEARRCEGFENLYLAGEGSGYSGGIISSGADGIKTALQIIGGSG